MRVEDSASAREHRSAPCLATGTQPSHPLTILLVEDEDFVRKVTSEVLRSFGYRVISAASAQEALLSFLKHRAEVGLVLTDVVMPGSNGRKLASNLKELSPSLEIIITSGYPEGFKDQSAAGTLHYLPKPYSVTSLLQKVEDITLKTRVLEARGQADRC